MSGYLRFPAVHGERVVFVHDDDVWSSPLSGGQAQRLTTSRAHISHPRISPDGRRIAFVAADEGLRDTYVIDADGGPPRRLTHEGGVAAVCGWSGNGSVVVASSAHRPFLRPTFLQRVPVDGGPSEPLPLGPATGWVRGPRGQVVLCRHTDDLARWKRYRGGRVGALWIDRTGDGEFERLVDLGGNLACPLWVHGRVWFVSDHEGSGNLYSLRPDGAGLTRHTDHTGFYARHPDAAGRDVVYGLGGDLWHVRAGREPVRIPIEVRASATQTRRKFVRVDRFWQGQDLSPDGARLALEVRGRPFTMAHFSGPVHQLGERDGVRYRLPRFHPDGKRLIVASDRGGADGIELLPVNGGRARRLTPEDMGRPVAMVVAPKGDRLAVSNHRQQLCIVDLANGSSRILDHAPGGPVAGMAWSHDGSWLAWSRPELPGGASARICLWKAGTEAVIELTDGRHFDWCPTWSPEGHLLFFLSRRDFDPVYDAQFFDLNFPRGTRPWAVTLRSGTTHPFRSRPRPIDQKGPKRSKGDPGPLRIDLEGLSDRMVPMPVKESVYDRIIAVKGGNVLMSRKAPSGSLGRSWHTGGPPKADKSLVLWDAHNREVVSVADGITDFGTDLRKRSMWVRSGWRLRVLPANPDKGTRERNKKTASGKPGPSSGWVDLNRVRCGVEPRAEWRQLFEESWRLMKEHFWNEDLSGVDWEAARERYAPLVERVATREELSDVIWTLIGELGTSHAYEMAGDLRSPPGWAPGRLAADWAWARDRRGWCLTRICRGDPGQPGRTSPLLEPGVSAAVGDRIRSIDGQRLTRTHGPSAALVHRAGQLVTLELERGGDVRSVVVRTLKDDRTARYREWVRTNRERVHQATDGRCGYVHIPDMGPGGYADFHRDFGVESRRHALVVDVRYNRGGHVSQLLLEKLARRPLAWTVSRWSQPQVYPRNAALGPMICLTNENAGSDGDIFSHNWKQLGLGPLVGRRTWGGVVGIMPRHRLADNTTTTQPEFAFWFPDARWGVENRGTEPDIDVDITPQDWAANRDPQLDTALAWIASQLEEQDPKLPDFGPGPNLGTRER